MAPKKRAVKHKVLMLEPNTRSKAEGSSTKKRTAPQQVSSSRSTKRNKRPAKTRKICKFLELPAELRNVIYEYCRPERREILVHNTGVRLLTSTRILRKRTLLPLTHVNRQIRYKYLPTFMRGFHHTIRVLNIPAYTEAFPTLPENITGTIVLDLSDLAAASGSESGSFSYGYGVNLTSLLKLRNDYPILNITTTSSAAFPPCNTSEMSY
ncbi:hypothetical protein CC86DRAFT_462949 [Ophiobolus disseminans]|uniref:F-box domain-containing protein n=1 Tax=Ophiobolus disseminans TaxID=1469910 RepID=A0A6A7AJ96_9PLEO|nr:hypothetical protein CC86DRAFT_462949 [Ophiobolus disseminans]